MNIDKKEREILLITIFVITLWFTFGIKYFYSISSNNASLFYLLFLVGYVLFVNKFIFNNGFEFKKVFSLFVVILVGGILFPPYLITIDKLPELSANLRYSEDAFIYSLMPLNWNHTVKYYLLYILIPVLLLALLAYINDRGKFTNLLKNGA